MAWKVLYPPCQNPEIFKVLATETHQTPDLESWTVHVGAGKFTMIGNMDSLNKRKATAVDVAEFAKHGIPIKEGDSVVSIESVGPVTETWNF